LIRRQGTFLSVRPRKISKASLSSAESGTAQFFAKHDRQRHLFSDVYLEEIATRHSYLRVKTSVAARMLTLAPWAITAITSV